MKHRCAYLSALLVIACGNGSGEVASAAQQPRPKPVAAPAAPAPDTPFRPPDARGWGLASDLYYLERVLGGGQPDAAMPMLVFIHGLGDRPHREWFGGAEAIDTPVRLIMPQAPTPYRGGGFSWFPFRAKDNDPEALARGIGGAADRLARAILVLRARRPTTGRPIIAGFSQGGMLSFALAVRHPDLVELAHPISGMLPEPLWPKERPAGTHRPRIAAMHGDDDDLVPIEPARKLVWHLLRLGYQAELRELPGVGHTITGEMEAHTVALVNKTARALAAPARPPPSPKQPPKSAEKR